MIFIRVDEVVLILLFISIGLSKVKYKKRHFMHYLVLCGHLFVLCAVIYVTCQLITMIKG